MIIQAGPGNGKALAAVARPALVFAHSNSVPVRLITDVVITNIRNH
jgi:hypothetical protein